MFKFIPIAILFIIIFVLDRLYLLPLDVPLDTKPNTRRSATYLAKTIAKEAKCDNVYLEDIHYHEGNTIFNFDCNFGSTEKNTYTPFYIHIFFNDNARDSWINRRNKDTSHGYHEQCFKKGIAYLICDGSWSPNITLQETKKNPISYGQKYYKQFPGKDLEYMVN